MSKQNCINMKAISFRRVLVAELIYFILMIFSQNVNAQLKETNFQIRVPLFFEIQKAEITYGPDQIQKATSLNFGIDGIIEKGIKKDISIGIGVGYYRNRFNIKRPYDHQSLEPNDSLPILLTTKNYNYHLLRIPVYFKLIISNTSNYQVAVELEHSLNFSFKRKYNGRKPFPEARDYINELRFFGNTLSAFINIRKKITHKSFIGIAPTLRLFNWYKKDKFLFENDNSTNRRVFDAFGFSFKYSVSLKP